MRGVRMPPSLLTFLLVNTQTVDSLQSQIHLKSRSSFSHFYSKHFVLSAYVVRDIFAFDLFGDRRTMNYEQISVLASYRNPEYSSSIWNDLSSFISIPPSRIHLDSAWPSFTSPIMGNKYKRRYVWTNAEFKLSVLAEKNRKRKTPSWQPLSQ